MLISAPSYWTPLSLVRWCRRRTGDRRITSLHLSGSKPPPPSLTWLADVVDGEVSGRPSDACYVVCDGAVGHLHHVTLQTASGATVSAASSIYPAADDRIRYSTARCRSREWGRSALGIAIDLARLRGDLCRNAADIPADCGDWGRIYRARLARSAAMGWAYSVAAVGAARLREIRQTGSPSPREAVLLEGTLGVPLPREMMADLCLARAARRPWGLAEEPPIDAADEQI